MSAPIELLEGFAATLLLGYLAGWPLSRAFGARFLPFALGGGLVALGALLLAGWPLTLGLPLAAVGVLTAYAIDRAVTHLAAAHEVAAKADHYASPSDERVDAASEDAETKIAETEVAETEVAEVAEVAEAEAEVAEAEAEAEVAEAEVAAEGEEEPAEEVAILLETTKAMSAVIPKRALTDTCPHCDERNDIEARFCQRCSGPLQPWTCHECGTKNERSAKFCMSCRTPLEMLASPLDVVDVEEKIG